MTYQRQLFEEAMGAALIADQGKFALSRTHDAEQSYTFLATKWAWKAWQLAAATPVAVPTPEIQEPWEAWQARVNLR